ncbi:MAG: alkaline phosphatase family protein, partial [Balneolaceae bacterium]
MIASKIGHFLAGLIAIGILILACTPQTIKKTEHVILIGVDGMSPDGVKHAHTPVMDEMMVNGAHSETARAVLPSSSGANWASMLNGAGPEQHGVISNSWRTDNFILPATVVNERNKFPSIFSVIRKHMPEATLGAIYHWGPIVNYFEEGDVDYSISPDSEEETTNLSVDFILENKPDFTFIHLDHVDGAGHGFGHGTQPYYDSVSKADSLIGLIVQATKDAGIFEDTIFIITSDHGGLGKGHGGPSLAEMGIPWIISGKHIKQNTLLNFPINTFDSPATVLYALGLDIPFEWIGRPVKGAFLGEPHPQLMFGLNAAMLNPVIFPQSTDGFTPAGGLFIQENAELTITNPNDRGEIRFTLDGSLPISESPIFSESITLEKTTVVRAQIFDGENPISQ